MRLPALAAVLFISVGAAAPAYAVHKCPDAHGKWVYSDLPCPSAAAEPAQQVAAQAPQAHPIALPRLTAGQGSPRELVTALFRCLEAASVGSKSLFLGCSAQGGEAYQQADSSWAELLGEWRRSLPSRMLATTGMVDKAERYGSISLVGTGAGQEDIRLSASFVRDQGLWKLVQLHLPPEAN